MKTAHLTLVYCVLAHLTLLWRSGYGSAQSTPGPRTTYLQIMAQLNRLFDLGSPKTLSNSGGLRFFQYITSFFTYLPTLPYSYSLSHLGVLAHLTSLWSRFLCPIAW